MKRRSLLRLTAAGIILERRLRSQKRINALRDRPIEPRPSDPDITRSIERWANLKHRV